MRIKITLSADKSGIIDFNYQHQIQAVIYGFLYRSNPDYAQWLHHQGFVYKRDKRFKLFVFSGIIFNGKIKSISSNRSNGLNGLNSLNSLNSLNGLSLKPLESPLFIKKPMPPGQQDIYLFPGDNGYEELLNQNLMHKYETLFGKPYQGETLKFCFLETKGKSVKQFTVFKKGLDGSVNPIHIKGTLQPFTVTGPKELIRIGLECGFGQNNSMGCGYVEVVQTVETIQTA